MREGSFVWHELVTPDVDGAAAFYARVVGWTTADSGMPGIRYTLAKVGDRPVAGFMATPPEIGEAPPLWFGYVLVSDVDAKADQVRQAGGSVMRPPADIPGIGRFAVVKDPQGAAFMLFQGLGEAPAGLDPKAPGTIGWHELRTSDWKSAFAFYQGLFGWEKSYAHDMGPMGLYQTFSVGDLWTGGMMDSPDAAPPRWSYYVTVDDIDAAAARVADAGGTVTSGPHPVPGGSWVVLATDPQGGPFALSGARRS